LLAGSSGLFVQLTVRELLWGHEDERACLQDEDEDDDSMEGDFFDEDADGFFRKEEKNGVEDDDDEKRIMRKRSDFRREGDNRCMFGILVKRNATWGPEIKAKTGNVLLIASGRCHC